MRLNVYLLFGVLCWCYECVVGLVLFHIGDWGMFAAMIGDWRSPWQFSGESVGNYKKTHTKMTRS
jgi:hypothetical protein